MGKSFLLDSLIVTNAVCIHCTCTSILQRHVLAVTNFIWGHSLLDCKTRLEWFRMSYSHVWEAGKKAHGSESKIKQSQQLSQRSQIRQPNKKCEPLSTSEIVHTARHKERLLLQAPCRKARNYWNSRTPTCAAYATSFTQNGVTQVTVLSRTWQLIYIVAESKTIHYACRIKISMRESSIVYSCWSWLQVPINLKRCKN